MVKRELITIGLSFTFVLMLSGIISLTAYAINKSQKLNKGSEIVQTIDLQQSAVNLESVVNPKIDACIFKKNIEYKSKKTVL